MVAAPQTELERMELTSQLEETLGTDAARTLMAYIPPIRTEQLATKDDLTLLKNDIDKDIKMVRKDLEMVENRLNTKIDRLDTKMDAGFKEIRAEIKEIHGEMKGVRGEMRLGIAQQTRQFITLGLTLAVPTCAAVIGLLVAIFFKMPTAI
ncbi:MAG: hypothetical protein OXI96_03130 [Acidimicrobiaceae bacterium]|nr:hypothetical protein [Acidimicrobiaceae bacterium]